VIAIFSSSGWPASSTTRAVISFVIDAIGAGVFSRRDASTESPEPSTM
jgi:hypothetical protein